MKWSYRIFRLAGIDVRVHVTFLLLLGFLALMSGSVFGAALNTAFIVLLFLCVLLHEFGHAFAARAYGIQTPDITLLPIGGVARLARMPSDPLQELVIAIAGPMVNVVIAIGLWLALGMPPFFGDPPDPEGLAPFLMARLFWVNKMLIAFNMIPAFPMDGGRVLRALLATRLGHVRATGIAAKVGQGIAILFAAAALLGIPEFLSRAVPFLASMDGNPFLLLIAMFVFMGAQQEAEYAKMRAATGGLRVGDAMVSRFHSLFGDMSITEAVAQIRADSQPIFPVTDAHLRLTGMVLRNELLDHEPAEAQAPLSTLAKSIPHVTAGAPFEQAFQLMQESGSPVLPVVNEGGQVVGLVSLNLLSERARAARA